MLDPFDPANPNRIPTVVINDFGCATLRNTDDYFKSGDPRYQSVESWEILTKIMKGSKQDFGKVGPKADVWSMATTLFELLSGGILPFIYRKLPLDDISIDMWETIGCAILNEKLEINEYCSNISVEAAEL